MRSLLSKYIKIKKEKTFLSNSSLFVIHIMVFISVLISFLYTLYNNQNEGYKYICLLPIAYGFAYFIVFRRRIFSHFRIFLTAFVGTTFIRYVCMPVIIVYSEYYGGRSFVPPTYLSLQKACILMLYELFISVLFIEILEHKKNSFKQKISYLEKFEFPKYNLVYLAFFAITISLSLLVPGSFELFSFITPRLSGAEHLISPPFKEAVVIYMMFTSKHLIFILLLTYCYKKFQLTSKLFYKNIAFIIQLFNICLFYGLNRSDLVMPAIASLLVYMLLFKDKNIIKYILVVGVVLFLVTIIADSRELASVSKHQSQIVDMADFIQGYFGGVYNVAISLETYEYFPEVRSIGRVLYDTFRPFIGFNVLLKNLAVNFTNTYFNQRLWFGSLSSQITPMIGQGYIHFGYILAPTLNCIVIALAYWMENTLYQCRRIEVFYFFSICLIRMAFLMGQNTGNISNELSMNLVMFGVVYFFNNKIYLTRQWR